MTKLTKRFLMTLLVKITRLKGKYHKSTLKNVEMLLAGLLSARSVSLYKIKDDLSVLSGKVNLSRHTHYKRLLGIFERYGYGSTRLFIDLLLWALSLVIDKAELFYWTLPNGRLVSIPYMCWSWRPMSKGWLLRFIFVSIPIKVYSVKKNVSVLLVKAWQ